MKKTQTHLLRLFVTGALAALPLAATVAIFWWAATMLIRWLGPNSLVGGALMSVGLNVTESEVVGYLIGMALVAVALTLLGALVSTGLQRGASRLFTAVIERIPVVATVYDLARKMVDLLAQRNQPGNEAAAKSMSPVWVRFGGDDGAAVLALLTTPTPVLVCGNPCLAVLVPTAPLPVGGGLIFVPQAWVQPAPIGMDGLTSLYVSMGVTAPQHLGMAAAGATLPPTSTPAPAPAVVEAAAPSQTP